MLKDLVQETINKLGYGITRVPTIHDQEKIIKKGKSIISKISPGLQVLNGPFKGLKYPSLDITEAALIPKIVGSYEAQLHPVLQEIFKRPYTDIIDVGSAEGYYAVGLATKMPGTTVHCFDINEKDLEFSKAMAKHNNVNNLTYNKECSPATLINFRFKGRGLIFCDCEGFELQLFTEEVVRSLKNVDVLVELHDIANPIISSEILTRFQHTHTFRVVNNLNVDQSGLQGLEQLPEDDKRFALLEHRGGLYQNIFMEWAFFTANEK
jgi:hypothetical protein